MTIRQWILVVAIAGLAGVAQAAPDQSSYQAVPAQPVASKNLEAISKTTNDLSNIVNKDETRTVQTKPPAPKPAQSKPQPRVVTPVPVLPPQPDLEAIAEQTEAAVPPPPPPPAPVVSKSAAAAPAPIPATTVAAPPMKAAPPVLKEGINEIPPSSNEWNQFFHIIFSGLVALFAAGLCFISWRQHKVLARSIEAAQAAGNAAKRSAEVAENALKNIERPYAFVSHVELCVPMAQIDVLAPHLHFGLANYGRTPAIMKALSTEIEMTDMAGMVTRFGSTRHDLPVINAGAGVEGIRFTYDGLSEEKRYKVTNGEIRLRLRVGLSYSDFFYSPPYLEEIRYIYDPLSRGFVKELEPIKKEVFEPKKEMDPIR